jgi:membrane protein YqaA with SNARE-associated domain
MTTHHFEADMQTAMQKAAATRNPIRKLYFWTLHWGTTRWAIPALVVLSFTESSFFPIPPDVLLIALCFAAPRKWFLLALLCTVASVLGGALGYAIGAWGMDAVGNRLLDIYDPARNTWGKITGWYEAYGFAGIVLAAITPIPYKVFTIASGAFDFSFWQFMFASTLGRGFRFFLVAGLIGYLGETIRPFIEKRLELMLIIFGILGVGGFVLLKFLR